MSGASYPVGSAGRGWRADPDPQAQPHGDPRMRRTQTYPLTRGSSWCPWTVSCTIEAQRHLHGSETKTGKAHTLSTEDPRRDGAPSRAPHTARAHRRYPGPVVPSPGAAAPDAHLVVLARRHRAAGVARVAPSAPRGRRASRVRCRPTEAALDSGHPPHVGLRLLGHLLDTGRRPRLAACRPTPLLLRVRHAAGLVAA